MICSCLHNCFCLYLKCKTIFNLNIPKKADASHKQENRDKKCKMSIRPCDKTSKTKPQRFWDALGPFPRSVWIHPCTPEDSLDRACGRVLKRYVLASKGVWPHLPENAHVFADEDGDIQSYTTRGHDGSLSTQSTGNKKLDKVMLMTQHNMTQTLLQGHVDATCPCFLHDRCSHGHEPDKTIEIEGDRRNTEEFLKEILPKKDTHTRADIPEGPSDEDFPPLPPPASPQVDRPPQQAPISKSGSYKATVFKEKPNIQLHGGKPQRAQKLNQKEHPRVSAKTTPKIEAQTIQGFIDQPSSPQTGSACREKVILEEQSSLPRCSHLPKDHTFKGGDVELGRSADGAHMAETRAGSGTVSVQNAAGSIDNAKCHIYRKDAAVAKTKATSPGSDMSMPEDMDGIQIWNSSGRCPLQNAQFFTGTGHGLWSLPANCFLWFPVTEVDPLHIVNPLFSSNFLPLPGFGLNPYYIVGDVFLWPNQHANYVNFPDNVNLSAAGRQRFSCPANVPPGFTVADAFTLF